MTYRAAFGGQGDGVVLASCFSTTADISDLTEVHNAPWFGVGNYILVCKAEEEALLEHKPAPSPGTQMFSLGLQPARLLCLVPELYLILGGQLQTEHPVYCKKTDCSSDFTDSGKT